MLGSTGRVVCVCASSAQHDKHLHVHLTEPIAPAKASRSASDALGMCTVLGVCVSGGRAHAEMCELGSSSAR